MILDNLPDWAIYALLVGVPIAGIIIGGLAQSSKKDYKKLTQNPNETAKACVGCIVMIILSLLFPTFCSDSSKPPPVPPPLVQPTTYNITYSVTGSATVANLTYRNESGGTDQMQADLPWSKTFRALPGSHLYISAQNDSDVGTVKVEIKVGGTVVQSGQTNAEYGIATASGRL